MLFSAPQDRMQQLTHIAGMRGTGKTTVLTSNRPKASSIEAENLQGLAIESATGIQSTRKYSWEIWDTELRARASDLLLSAMRSKYPSLENNGKPILVAGSLLVKDWFREAIEIALSNHFSATLYDIEHYVLHPDAKAISKQIQKRGRAAEQHYIGNLPLIQKGRDGYWEMAKKSCRTWKKIRCQQELNNMINRRT